MTYSIILEDFSLSNCSLLRRFKNFSAYKSGETMVLISESECGDSEIADTAKSICSPTIMIPHDAMFAITEN